MNNSQNNTHDVEYEDKVERFEMKINESTRLLYSSIKDLNKVYHNDFLLCLIGHYIAVNPDKLDLVRGTLKSALGSKPDATRKLAICEAAINNISNLKIPQVYPQAIIDDIISAINHIVINNPAIDISGIPQSILSPVNVEHDIQLHLINSDTVETYPANADVIEHKVMIQQESRLPLSVNMFSHTSLNTALKAELLRVLDFADHEVPDNALDYYNSEYSIIKNRVIDIVSRHNLSKTKHEHAVEKALADLSNVIKSFNIELTYVLQQYCYNREVVECFLSTNPKNLERYFDARFAEYEQSNIYAHYKSGKSIWALTLSQINEICDSLEQYQVKADFVISASTLKSPQVKLKAALGTAYGFVFKDKLTSYEFTSF